MSYGSTTGSVADTGVRQQRLDRVRQAMSTQGVDVLLLSLGADLPWLSGYEAMPLERLTMLVVPVDGQPTMVIPRLEAPRVDHHEALFDMCPWGETENPLAVTASLVGAHRRMAVSDRCWSTFVLGLQQLLPGRTWVNSSTVTSPLRARKDDAEIAALTKAGAAADRVAAQLHGGQIPLIGRTEAAVSTDISQRLLDEGHDKVNFAIVASMENAASPHHHASTRVIGPNEVVLCDFGGTMDGYCSDITRCVHTGPVPAERQEIYDILFASQAAGVAAGVVGVGCQEVDRASRKVIADAGWGDYFIHRTGHGIGMEEHEDPYMVEGNHLPLAAGHAYSVEPGIYLPGRFGFRLEDIVVSTDSGPLPLNHTDHRLVVVEA